MLSRQPRRREPGWLAGWLASWPRGKWEASRAAETNAGSVSSSGARSLRKRPLPKQRSVLYHRVVLSVCDAASLVPVNLRNPTDGLPSISCICCASSFARAPPSRRRACLSAERGPSQSAADGLQSRQRAAPCVCAGLGLAARPKRVLTAEESAEIDRTRACNPARARGASTGLLLLASSDRRQKLMAGTC